MGNPKIKKPLPVKFVVAITFQDDECLKNSIDLLTQKFGQVDCNSLVFDFDHTTYYEKEMGENLKKQFFSFEKIDDREKLVDLKYLALDIEKKFSVDEKRIVNIDPAYIESSKLVVSSTKNFSHRVYINRGIYGDVQLQYKNKCFVSYEWTYPDYQSDIVQTFLLAAREIYSQQLKNVT